MKKIKKLLAMIMAMTMVLGMAMTVSAAPDEATITIEEAGNATFKYLQIVGANPKTETGWEFLNGAGQYFQRAFNVSSDQEAIKSLIEHKKNNNHAGEFSKALSAVASGLSGQYSDMTNPQTVSKAGIYSIKGEEPGYIYSNMAAFVGFGEVDGTYPLLEDATLTAKKVPTSVGKSSTDQDKVVAIGDIVTYEITAQVPYIAPDADDSTFYIYDDLKGADYYLTGDGAVAKVEIKEGDTYQPVDWAQFEEDSHGHGLYIDLSRLINEENSNAMKDIKVTYTAKVTQVTVNNTAGANAGGIGYSEGKTDVYTGEITLKKYDEEVTDKYLAGAVFKVWKSDSTIDNALTFTKESDGVYVYNPDSTETEVTTGANGTLVIKGLGVGTYNFKEIQAPDGYHIANTPGGVDATAELKVSTPDGTANAKLTAKTELANTRLSSLPSTGGIGTTIFTIGGCAIMIAAAALYFVNRRKSEEN